MQSRCFELLDAMGFSLNHNGYYYIAYAVDLILHNPTLVRQTTTQLYPLIAQKFEVSSCSVERCIRSSIEYAWLKGDIKLLNKLFLNKVDADRAKPTNSIFLSVVSKMVYQAIPSNEELHFVVSIMQQNKRQYPH